MELELDTLAKDLSSIDPTKLVLVRGEQVHRNGVLSGTIYKWHYRYLLGLTDKLKPSSYGSKYFSYLYAQITDGQTIEEVSVNDIRIPEENPLQRLLKKLNKKTIELEDY